MGRSVSGERIALLGVPRNSSGTTEGVARAPGALREVGLLKALSSLRDVEDLGDVRFAASKPQRDQRSGIVAIESLVSMVEATREAVARAFSERRFSLVVGGDDPPLLGCLMAASETHGRVGLLFVDGHEDAYPPHDSPTGEAADMELGLALGRGLEGLPRELRAPLPLLDPSDVALLGPRDAGILREDGVASLQGEVEFYDDEALLEVGAGEAVGRALSRIGRQVDALWLHVDLDVLSTEALPAAADPEYLQPGGISWQDLEAITHRALSHLDVVGWTVVDYNPDLDPDGRHARRVVEYLRRGASGLPTATS